MPRHHNHKPYPPLPPVESHLPLSDAQITQIRTATALAGLHNVYNVARTLNKLNKWGSPEQIRVTAYVVSDQPIDGVPAEDSLDPTSGLHIAFRDEDNALTGHTQATGERVREAPTFRAGVLLKDRKGRGWFHDFIDDTLTPVTLNTPPIMKDLVLNGQELADLTPVFGEFQIEYQNIRAMQGDLIPVDHPEPLDARIDEILDRENQIAGIVADRLTEDAFGRVIDTLTFPTKQGIFPAHDDFDVRERFDEALDQLAWDVLVPIRDAGLCAPCPNNGPRAVRGMQIWDAFLEGRLDGDEDTLKGDDRLWKAWIDLAPAFKVFQMALIRVSMDAEDAKFKTLYPGVERDHGSDRQRIPFTREDAMAVFPAFRDKMVEMLSYEEEDALLDADLRDGQSGDKLVLVESILKPVLAHWKDRKTPLPSLDAPKTVRHYTLTLPTGRLAMADYFRIPGFKDSLEKIVGEDEDGVYYDINNVDGLNQRAHDYLTKAGIAIVQVGNSSPQAYADGKGIWRMGRVSDESTKNAGMTPAWRTCTDLWANTFASPEAIVNVLMQSGLYETEIDAEQALKDYCEETYGAHIINLGIETLHVYAPTGDLERKHGDLKGVGKGVLTRDKHWKHQYVLADRELIVDPKVLSREVWEAAPLLDREPGFTI